MLAKWPNFSISSHYHKVIANYKGSRIKQHMTVRTKAKNVAYYIFAVVRGTQCLDMRPLAVCAAGHDKRGLTYLAAIAMPCLHLTGSTCGSYNSLSCDGGVEVHSCY